MCAVLAFRAGTEAGMASRRISQGLSRKNVLGAFLSDITLRVDLEGGFQWEKLAECRYRTFFCQRHSVRHVVEKNVPNLCLNVECISFNGNRGVCFPFAAVLKIFVRNCSRDRHHGCVQLSHTLPYQS